MAIKVDIDTTKAKASLEEIEKRLSAIGEKFANPTKGKQSSTKSAAKKETQEVKNKLQEIENVTQKSEDKKTEIKRKGSKKRKKVLDEEVKINQEAMRVMTTAEVIELERRTKARNSATSKAKRQRKADQKEELRDLEALYAEDIRNANNALKTKERNQNSYYKRQEAKAKDYRKAIENEEKTLIRNLAKQKSSQKRQAEITPTKNAMPAYGTPDYYESYGKWAKSRTSQSGKEQANAIKEASKEAAANQIASMQRRVSLKRRIVKLEADQTAEIAKQKKAQDEILKDVQKQARTVERMRSTPQYMRRNAINMFGTRQQREELANLQARLAQEEAALAFGFENLRRRGISHEITTSVPRRATQLGTRNFEQSERRINQLGGRISQNSAVFEEASQSALTAGRGYAQLARGIGAAVTSTTRFLTLTAGIATMATAINTLQNELYKVSEVAQLLDRAKNVFTFALGDDGKAVKEMERLIALSKEYRVNSEAVLMTAPKFYAASAQIGIPLEDIRSAFDGIVKAQATFRLTAQETERVFFALSQIASKGKVSMEELRLQLGESLPGAMAIAANSIGVTQGQLEKLVSSGQLMAKDFLPLFGAELNRVFGVSAAATGKGVTGSIQAIMNTAFEARSQFATQNEDRIVGTLELVNQKLKEFLDEIVEANPAAIFKAANFGIIALAETAKTTAGLLKDFGTGVEEITKLLRNVIPGYNTPESQKLTTKPEDREKILSKFLEGSGYIPAITPERFQSDAGHYTKLPKDLNPRRMRKVIDGEEYTNALLNEGSIIGRAFKNSAGQTITEVFLETEIEGIYKVKTLLSDQIDELSRKTKSALDKQKEAGLSRRGKSVDLNIRKIQTDIVKGLLSEKKATPVHQSEFERILEDLEKGMAVSKGKVATSAPTTTTTTQQTPEVAARLERHRQVVQNQLRLAEQKEKSKAIKRLAGMADTFASTNISKFQKAKYDIESARLSGEITEGEAKTLVNSAFEAILLGRDSFNKATRVIFEKMVKDAKSLQERMGQEVLNEIDISSAESVQKKLKGIAEVLDTEEMSKYKENVVATIRKGVADAIKTDLGSDKQQMQQLDIILKQTFGTTGATGKADLSYIQEAIDANKVLKQADLVKELPATMLSIMDALKNLALAGEALNQRKMDLKALEEASTAVPKTLNDFRSKFRSIAPKGTSDQDIENLAISEYLEKMYQTSTVGKLNVPKGISKEDKQTALREGLEQIKLLQQTTREEQRITADQAIAMEFDLRKQYDETFQTRIKQTEQVRSALVGAFDDTKNAFMDFVRTGEISFSSMVENMLARLLELQYQMKIIDPLAKSLSDGSDGFGGIFRAFGLGGNEPTTAAEAVQRNNIPGLSGNRVSGGWVEAGKRYNINERPSKMEAFIPSTPGRVVPVGGGNNVVNVNVNNQTGAQVEVNQSQDSAGNINLDLMITNAVNSAARAGKFDQTFRAIYGLKRKGT